MDRRYFVGSLALLAGAPLLGTLQRDEVAPAGAGLRPAPPDWEPLELSREEWRDVVSEREFRILRKAGTEPAGSSPLNQEKRTGTFVCAGCFLPLFSSGDKFMSGTGWPSFTGPLNDENIETKLDFKLILPRTEYHCARCGGHQGHVFDDGPPPTGQRWCNNGAALDFVPEGEPLPELRT